MVKTRMLATLGATHYCILASILIVVALALVSSHWPRLAEEYILNEKAPPLERDFGFQAEYIQPVEELGWQGRVFTITDVLPGGLLDRAGFRDGDLPSLGICLFQGDYVAAKAFFERLEDVRAGQSIELLVGRPEGGRVSFNLLTLEPDSSR